MKPAILVTVSKSGQVTITAHSNIKDAVREGKAWQKMNEDNPNWIAHEQN
jgi:hypothetical protein